MEVFKIWPMISHDSLSPIANEPTTGSMREHLVGALARVIPRDIRIATAYLTPDGFLDLKEGMKNAAGVRLLLGERPFLNRRGPGDVLAKPHDHDELFGPAESVDWYTFLERGYPWLLLTHEERRELLARGVTPETAAFDLSAWERVTALADFLRQENVEVRRFLGSDVGTVLPEKILDHRSPRNRLHAKAYLFTGEMGHYAAVGSSNLTKSGLSENSELNLASYDRDLTAILEGWFDEKWELGQDCKGQFIQRLEECVLFGRRYTPWQVMLKSLHAAYGRFLELGLSEEVMGRLAGFQQQAVQRCVALLKRHWGAMLCDSVGLGKTYEGLGILREFASQRDEDQRGTTSTRALIVCPAQLQDNWSTDRFADWGIIATTVSMESLPSLADIEEEPSAIQRQRLHAELRRYQDQYDIILVDESHNFRNPRTKRYRALMDIIRGGKPDTRVVLLTATPINNSVWDLYHQLMLITRGDDTWYAGRGPIPNLRAAFQAIEKGESDSGLLDTMMLSLVRRTRHDIRSMQEAGETMEVNGQPLSFPEHEIPKAVDYSLQGLYGNIYLDIIDAIEHLSFAVYRLDEYGVETGEKETSAQLRQRNANFVGIMRTILLKRMESSLAALTSTVRSLVDYFSLFLSRLEAGRVLTPKQAYKLRGILGGSLPDHDQDIEDLDPRAVAALQQELQAPEDVDLRAKLEVDVGLDRDRLQTLLTRLQWLEEMLAEQGDPKARAVRELLEKLPKEDANGQPTKVTLFTTYKDTAQDLFQQFGGDPESLKSSVRVRSNLEDKRWMSLLTGRDDQNRRRTVLERFAPLATHRETEPLDDPALLRKIEPLRAQSIELLIATDVLSEGQNLQDAQFLINYDLPWNPVRMIQRAGRIDRLFSPHDKVYIYNLMPEDGLEDLLNLVQNLSTKIATIEDAVALDASVLGEQIEAKELDKVMKLRAGGVQADQVYREGERSQGLDEGAVLLNRYLDMMKDFATEDVRDIPNGVYSVKTGMANGVYIMLKMPEEASGEVFWRFYPLGNVSQPVTSPNEVLSIVESNRDEQRLEMPPDEHPFRHLEEPLRAAVNQIGQAYLDAVSSVTSDNFTRRVRQFLNRDDLLAANPGLFQFFSDWIDMPLPSDTVRRVGMRDPVRILNRLAPTRAELSQIVQALTALRSAIQSEGLDRPLQRPDTRQPSVEDLELVAWELVVGPEGLPGTPQTVSSGSSDGALA